MLTILQGDAIEQLRTLTDESVQCCVTSPPYWGLRDYGTAAWEGGDATCDHSEPPRGGRNPETAGKQLTNSGTLAYQYARDCGKCGATRIDSQLGLEKTPEEYVAKMVEVFREVRRVLRKDGTLWLNLGDSYNAAREGGHAGGTNGVSKPENAPQRSGVNAPGLKPKDLCGIPWRVAFALQADGWWLRSDIIWAKPNPMPESVTDRPTKSHEYLFLLTKSANYFYDAEAIKEQNAPATIERAKYGWCTPDTKAAQYQGMNGLNRDEPYPLSENGRNKRSVWTVATAPYPEAHFATYPPDLIKPCIMAGTRVGDTVLDTFAGSGTTGMVAIELGRKAVLIELNPMYVELIRQRCDITPGLQLA